MRNRRPSIALLFGFMVWSVFALAQPARQVSLDGTWELREVDSLNWLPATVPGTVHTDLLALNRIPDPYFGRNEKAVQWIEDRDWEYRKRFNISPEQIQSARIELLFEGLDTYCDVFLNGKLLGRTDNMHRRWGMDCKKALKVGANELRLRFYSPIKTAMPGFLASPFSLSSGNDASPTKVSPYVRKAAYHFGWDFGPRLVTAGIWRSVTLRLWNDAQIKKIDLRTIHLSNQQADLTANLELDVAKAGIYGIEVQTTPGSWDQPNNEAHLDTLLRLKKGKQRVALPFALLEPKIWWPLGMGDPNRYELVVRLKLQGMTVDEKHQKFGLRRIELVREIDAMGTSFFFRINDSLPGGGPLFIKGANYVPSDAFLPRGANKQIQLLEAAKAVGMNMIRVWGGGVYADEAFYEWCDANGMLVWQDLAFACMMYPLERKFLENALLEVEDNVQRLRHHPSLALWCGNNEIDVAWHNWGWQQEFKYSEEFAAKLWKEYVTFFQQEVPKILKANDPQIAYISTSPLSNWGKEENFNHHNMHYWGVWHGTDSLDGFSHYVPRFMSEYGFQSWPSEQTLRGYIDSADWDVDSAAIRNRQKSYKGNAPILKFLRPLYGEPKDFSAFLTLSQLLQRDAMTLAIEAHRMKSPHCMGTLYWQLGDCWPGASWSTVDFDGVWKPAHYALKRLYAPYLIHSEIKNDSLWIKIANDQFARNVRLVVHMGSFTGDTLGIFAKSFLLQKGVATYIKLPLNTFAEDFQPQSTFISTVVSSEGKALASDIRYFVSPKAMTLPEPQLKFNVTAEASGFWLEIESPTLVKDLEIKTKAAKIHCSENFIDLLPNSPHRIHISSDTFETALELEKGLIFTDFGSLVRH
jgi:beta-mannosidase